MCVCSLVFSIPLHAARAMAAVKAGVYESVTGIYPRRVESGVKRSPSTVGKLSLEPITVPLNDWVFSTYPFSQTPCTVASGDTRLHSAGKRGKPGEGMASGGWDRWSCVPAIVLLADKDVSRQQNCQWSCAWGHGS